MNKHIDYKYELLRDGAHYMDLKAVDGGQITCNYLAEIKRAISCSIMIPKEANMLTDEVRVSLIKDGVTTSLGVFNMTTVPKMVNDDGQIFYNCEGYDRTYYVKRRRLESRRDGYIAMGTRYTEAIQRLLSECGINTMQIQNSPLMLSQDREDWEVGTSYLTIINKLLDEMNYGSLWFDENGIARAEKYVSVEDKPTKFNYAAGKNSIIMRNHNTEEDYFDAYNVFIVGVSNPQGEPMYATSANRDINSKISTVYRGRIASPVVMLESVANEETLQEYADNLVLKSRVSTETATIQTEIEAGHGAGDIVTVNIPELQGRFEEVSWEIPLSIGLMRHKIRRAAYV